MTQKNPNASRLTAFIGVTPRLEYLLDQELRAAGFDVKNERVKGGVEVFVDQETLWRIIHTSRLAESVRVRLGAWAAHNFEQLQKGLLKLPWNIYFARGNTPKVEAVCKKSTLYHSDAVAESAASAIHTRLAKPDVAPQTPASVIHLRLVNDVVQVTVDAVGEPLLHRRGYRKHVGKAPMRETLAAALLAMIPTTPQEPRNRLLWDPFCGSGTIPLEHTLKHLKRPAIVGHRAFAFEQWPTHKPDAYQAFLQTLPAPESPATSPPTPQALLAIGSDIDPKEVQAAQANAATADALDFSRFEVGDFERVEPTIPHGAMIASNLPYGQRIESDRTLVDAFQRFGTMLRKRVDLRPVVVVNGHPQFQALTRLRWQVLHDFSNRGLRVEVLMLTDE